MRSFTSAGPLPVPARVTFVAGVMLVTALAVMAFPGRSHAAVWPPSQTSCAGNALDALTHPRRDICIAERMLRSRGRIQRGCLVTPPVPGQVYPRRTACGSGPEAIAQGRMIAKLSSLSGTGVSAENQWEVGVKYTDKPGETWKRADITRERVSSLDVYEVKLISNPTWPDTAKQLDRYI